GVQRGLPRRANHDDLFDPGLYGLRDHDVDDRYVHERQHLLRDGLRDRKEARAESGGRNDRDAHGRGHRFVTLTSKAPACVVSTAKAVTTSTAPRSGTSTSRWSAPSSPVRARVTAGGSPNVSACATKRSRTTLL